MTNAVAEARAPVDPPPVPPPPPPPRAPAGPRRSPADARNQLRVSAERREYEELSNAEEQPTGVRPPSPALIAQTLPLADAIEEAGLDESSLPLPAIPDEDVPTRVGAAPTGFALPPRAQFPPPAPFLPSPTEFGSSPGGRAVPESVRPPSMAPAAPILRLTPLSFSVETGGYCDAVIAKIRLSPASAPATS
jgi:hypothetical protein